MKIFQVSFDNGTAFVIFADSVAAVWAKYGAHVLRVEEVVIH